MDQIRPSRKKKGGSARKIAFQGELGAFSQQAIVQLAGPKAQPVPKQRFEDVFQALKRGEVDSAALPIENTLAGSVHENYDLLLKYDFEIRAETNVRIVHHLIAAPGVDFSSIRRVYSHPVALNQCLNFFARHRRMERSPFYDTAGSVKMLMEEKPAGAAAIASELAAKIYGAKILKREIEDDRRNFTRFFLLEPRGSKTAEKGRGEWKTSLVFSTRNAPGSLFRALSALALRDLNLAKIESRPRRGKPWEYMFYLDVRAHRDDPRMKNALSHLGELADFLRVLGSYRAA